MVERLRVIGLDLGTKCGWASTTTEGTLSPARSGVWDFSPRRFEGGGFRFLRFESCLVELLGMSMAKTVVFFEDVRRHEGTTAAHVFGGFKAVLGEVCERDNIPYSCIPVADIKKRATGKGNASKDAVKHAAKLKWGVGSGNREWVPEEDQADALWIAQCGLDELRL